VNLNRLKSRLAKYWHSSKRTENDYWLTRFLLLRILGFTYFFGFLSLWNQLVPLLGSNGLTPVSDLSLGSVTVDKFIQWPTLFWFNQSDQFMIALALIGLMISFLILVGFANVPMLFANWLIYLSFVNVGQVWYGYGWETQLVETGLLAVFLVPLIDPRPFRKNMPMPSQLVWLFRWLAVRVYLGAGLIKVKGVPCWDNLTCLDRFFQTQPIPNPVSPWFHHMPSPVHKLGVLYTHFVQLVAPYSALFENNHRKLRIYGGLLMLSMQLLLIFVGNLALLNWVTIVAVISYFDDRFLRRFMPNFIVEKARTAKENSRDISDLRHGVNWILVFFVIILSVPVVVNLLSPTQAMNTSFNRWNFVNSYGAFGSVRDERLELVVEGTQDPILADGAEWEEYNFPAKPDDPSDPHPVIAPYQPRIAWQMWFASMSSPDREPWLLHLVWKLLENDPQGTTLLKENPFEDEPPRYIRIMIYRYEMQPPLQDKQWDRKLLGTWMPPVSQNNTQLRRYVRANWPNEIDS